MADTTVYDLAPGESPLLVSMPHVGTGIPSDLAGRLTTQASVLPDTDWHLDRLYNFLGDLNVSVIKARYSRYVIDLNRRADGLSLYPGQSVTDICPLTGFSGEPLYLPGQEPEEAEVSGRIEQFWQPYHSCLQEELARIKEKFGYAVLWDAHSIRSEVPRFFPGKLPDLNFGSGDGTSCAPSLTEKLQQVAAAFPAVSQVLNGRFKGGAITRLYGHPEENIHALQLELSQSTYMDESPPFTFREELADSIRPLLRDLLNTALMWTPDD
ncbi:MAG: N-formylglutamate deformylase [Gammaproteobacteria bacterium]|nr:N-formylglutamate deformylase [Gammaproteobacteria bacterium]